MYTIYGCQLSDTQDKSCKFFDRCSQKYAYLKTLDKFCLFLKCDTYFTCYMLVRLQDIVYFTYLYATFNLFQYTYFESFFVYLMYWCFFGGAKIGVIKISW